MKNNTFAWESLRKVIASAAGILTGDIPRGKRRFDRQRVIFAHGHTPAVLIR